MKDIIWYTQLRQADGSYTVTAKVSDHENAGYKYEAQVFYVDAKGQNKFVKSLYYYKNQFVQPALSWPETTRDTGTSSSRMSTALASGLQVPTWSDKDGQDDIRWKEATRQAKWRPASICKS